MFSCLQILEAFLWFVLITLLNVTLIILTLSVSRLLNLLLRLVAFLDRKSGSAGMPRPISYAVFCLKKKKTLNHTGVTHGGETTTDSDGASPPDRDRRVARRRALHHLAGASRR